MAQDFGNGVTRTLQAAGRQFQVVVWQAGKPPLDSELNLMMQADWERLSDKVRSEMPSGWIMDPRGCEKDYLTQENWANFFKLGRPQSGSLSTPLWANVNGWIIPVTGTGVADGDSSNRVNLYPGPSSDARTDLVFLEVWLAQVAPNPSTTNKPSASTIYKYGNVKFGGTNIADDLEDPSIGVETTERVQLQYRIRVFGSGAGLGDSVDLSTYPDGVDDPNVLAQGAATSPQAGFTFANMRNELGDAGLWRSGDGDPSNNLGTVDGYVYAIPISGVFRRNTGGFVARTAAGNARQQGAMNRYPYTAAIVDPVEGTKEFGTVTLTSAIDEAASGAVQFDNLSGSGLDNADLLDGSAEVFFKLDDEIIGVNNFSTAGTPGTLTISSRGRNATKAVPHAAGTEIKFFVFRPDAKTADMITQTDILDLRRAVGFEDMDAQALLVHNLNKLFEGSLRSSYKQGADTDTEGTVVIEVDTLWANSAGTIPNQTEALDGPDGIREVFSDAAVTQAASLILNPDTSSGAGTPVTRDYTTGAGAWPSADFNPNGFQPEGTGWTNQAVIGLDVGGATTNLGARGTVRDSVTNRWCRFLTPREAWLSRDNVTTSNSEGAQTPFQIRFFGESWGDAAGGDETAANHPGPMFPLPEHNFERPFIVLGGIVNTDLRSEVAEAFVAGSSPAGLSTIRVTGLNFDASGAWWDGSDVESLETSGLTKTLLYGARNLFDMLTNGGQDRSGRSSELYLVLTGTSNTANTGVWRVVGAGDGTAGYTTISGSNSEDLVVERVGEGSSALLAEGNVTIEVRSQYTHTQDGDAVANGSSALVVLTDLESAVGGVSSPWSGVVTAPITGQAILDTTVQYGPSRGGTARVADRINRVAMVGIDSADMVREAPTTIDAAFVADAGVPNGELYFPTQHVQSWNRLPSLGLAAPYAPANGENTYIKEQRREAEVFVDPGSKTLVVRPYQRTDITMNRHQITSGRLFPATYTAGSSSGVDVDGGGIMVADADYGYAFPWEYMPKFGRQDIPYHQTTGTGQTVYPGVNHMFGDSQTPADDVFRVLGGPNNASAVQSLFFQTGSTSGRDWGEYYNMGGSAVGYQAKLYSDVNAFSSDLPTKGLRGIQLPPFLGIARLYGVYDLREFAGLGAWASDRVTPETSGRPVNLLRTDADKQTLYILKGGGSSITGNGDDHTYIIPEDLIDIELSGSYTAGQDFDDIEFVVECVVFGFGRGFINLNNYIVARRNLPTGSSGTAVAALADDVSMIAPQPLPFNEQLYVAYERTVYQGDPYMTRDGATKTASDYENRLGQIPQSSAFELGTSIQQFDSTNNYAQVPEKPNARTLEVLATVDFWTTLGTGKVGGPVYSGTFTDVGHIVDSSAASTRIPAASSDAIWQSEPRTFTEPVCPSAPRAQLRLQVLQDSATSAGETLVLFRGDDSVTLTSNTSFSGGTAALTAASLATAINSNVIAQNQVGVSAVYTGGTEVVLVSYLPGPEGKESAVKLSPASGSRLVAGFSLLGNTAAYGSNTPSSLSLQLDWNRPMNGRVGNASSPIKLTGLTERLPMGILLQDSDFVGEDPLREGVQLRVSLGGGALAGSKDAPLSSDEEYSRVQAAGQIGMADGGILLYSPYSLSNPSGTKKYRLYRGGGSLYSLDGPIPGGPLDFSAGGLPAGAEPVLKGGVLAARAYLVRNYPEEAYSGNERKTWGDELQMVIVTAGVLGHGPLCDHGYDLSGQISPTGFGEGMVAADRYRLEGKPMMRKNGLAPADPDIELAPYESVDEADPDICEC